MLPSWTLEALPLQPNTFKFETNFGWYGQVVVGAKSKYHISMVALSGPHAPLEYSTYEWNVRTRANLQKLMTATFDTANTANHLVGILLADAFIDRLDTFFHAAIKLMLNLENSVWDDPKVVTYGDADAAYGAMWGDIYGDFEPICLAVTAEPLLSDSSGIIS